MKSTFDTFKISETGINFEHFFKVYVDNNDKLWTEYRENKIKKKELIEMRFQLTFEELGIKNISPQEIDDFYLQTIAKQPILEDGATEILNYAQKKGYRLFIITNGFRKIQQKKMESSGLIPYFEKIFVSEDVKMPKPGRPIFEYAIKSANAKKQQSLMIGDDWEADIVGALNFGIDSVFVCDPNEKTKSQANKNTSVTQINNLKALLDII